MGKYRYKIKEQTGTIPPEDLDPQFIKRIEDSYGPMDMENDFFADNLETYYKTTSISPEGGIEHKIIQLGSFKNSLQALQNALESLIDLSKSKQGENDSTLGDLVSKLKDVFNKYRTHLRKSYPDQYSVIKNLIDEISTTGGGSGAASFSPGTGAQYATPFAFNRNKKSDGSAAQYYYKLGYKKVPKKIKGSGLEVKKLYEEEIEGSSNDTFQTQRIQAFDLIEKEINDIYKILSNAKNETINYYNENPGSYNVIKPTDLVLDYIKDIKSLLIDE